MNILILNWRDIKNPLSGGAEISLFEHAKYWQKKGAHIIWFASSFKGAKKEEHIENIIIIRRGSHYTVYIYALFFYLRYLKNKVDVVVDNFHFIPFFTPLYIKRKKIVALINEPAKSLWFKNIFFPLSLIGYVIEPLFFLFYKNISFITSANSIMSELEEFGIKKQRINVIPHGVTISNKKKKLSKEKNPVIIYLSQVSPDKGIEDAIRAFFIIHKTRKNVKLWVVGKAKDRKYELYIKKFAEKLNLKDSIVFFGFVEEEKKFDLLKKSWVLIHTSLKEGWGLNVIEANAMRTIAVAYNVTGLRDSIQDGITGVLTKSNSPEAIAESIKTLINDSLKYKFLSRNAYNWAKSFSWEGSGMLSWSLLSNYVKK